MERSLTYSDHSTNATSHYFTRAPHKSYGPMTQLLPGPQCHTRPNRFTSNFSLFLHPSLPSPLRPPRSLLLFMLGLSVPFSIHPAPSTSQDFFSPPHASVCPSALFVFVCPILLASIAHPTFTPLVSISLPLSFLFVALCSCVTYASSGIPFLSCCGSCPLHVAGGWSFEESSRHLSLSAALSLNCVANPPLIPSLQLALWSLPCVCTSGERQKECKKSFIFDMPTQISEHQIERLNEY